MFKIKLLILLLASFLLSCTSNKDNNVKNDRYAVEYIAGEFDGVVLRNFLTNNLSLKQMYDEHSDKRINAKINHQSNLYITNIDNTSDRENILSKLNISIKDLDKNCIIFEDESSLSQFYIFAPSDQFLSNQKAIKEIKRRNTETLVVNLINKINNIGKDCIE